MDMKASLFVLNFKRKYSSQNWTQNAIKFDDLQKKPKINNEESNTSFLTVPTESVELMKGV